MKPAGGYPPAPSGAKARAFESRVAEFPTYLPHVSLNVHLSAGVLMRFVLEIITIPAALYLAARLFP